MVNNTDDSNQPTKYVPVPGDDEKVVPPEQIIKPVDKRWFVARICGKYNQSFLLALALQYINTGMNYSMMGMALQYMFWNNFGLSPGKAT